MKVLVGGMRYKAIFFDRDGTLTYFNKEKENWRDQKISEWSGKSFELSYEKMMNLFHAASEGKTPWYRNIDDEQLKIAKYFTSFTASSLVGAGKPSPVIFNAALNAQGVSAEQSLYVDDYKPEADGAREQGFTSFLIDRSGNDTDKWCIKNLKQLIDFAESQI